MTETSWVFTVAVRSVKEHQFINYDAVTWPWNVELVTLVRLELNISNTAADRDSVPKDLQ